MTSYVNLAKLHYYGFGRPGAFCNTTNTSYADPPKMHLSSSLSREIHCGALLLMPGSRASAATYTDSRGLRCDLGGSAQIDVRGAYAKHQSL